MLENTINAPDSCDTRPFEPDFPGKRNPWDKDRHPKNYNYVESLIQKVDAEFTRPVKYPEEVKHKVYELRAKGYTLRQIAEEVKVSKSTCCLYLQKQKKTVKVRQPGTSNVVTTDYSLREVDLGKIPSKEKPQ